MYAHVYILCILPCICACMCLRMLTRTRNTHMFAPLFSLFDAHCQCCKHARAHRMCICKELWIWNERHLSRPWRRQIHADIQIYPQEYSVSVSLLKQLCLYQKPLQSIRHTFACAQYLLACAKVRLPGHISTCLPTQLPAWPTHANA